MSYDAFLSTSGLSTRSWGPSGWFFLFSCIMGTYPPKLNPKDSKHIIIRKHFKQMFVNLEYTMPCIFCRESFKKFRKELPIEPFLKGRIELMYWLYLIKDKVNNKLINQEKECFSIEKKKLLFKLNKKQITNKEYNIQLKKIKKETIITKQSPPFVEILLKYEAIRAKCSKKAKTCSLPKQKNANHM